jgi:hypothetical protein
MPRSIWLQVKSEALPILDTPSPIMPQLQALLGLWRARNKPERLPMRSDFADEDMRPFFGNVFIVDVLQQAPYFRFRLFGVSLVNAANREWTGKTMEEIDISPYEPDVFDSYHRVRDSAQPMAQIRSFEPPPGAFTDEWRRYERLLLPLGNGGTKVEQILGCSYPLAEKSTSEQP